MSTSPNTLNFLTVERLLEELDVLYPPTVVGPQSQFHQVLYSSSQRSVVEWIKERVQEP